MTWVSLQAAPPLQPARAHLLGQCGPHRWPGPHTCVCTLNLRESWRMGWSPEPGLQLQPHSSDPGKDPLGHLPLPDLSVQPPSSGPRAPGPLLGHTSSIRPPEVQVAKYRCQGPALTRGGLDIGPPVPHWSQAATRSETTVKGILRKTTYLSTPACGQGHGAQRQTTGHGSPASPSAAARLPVPKALPQASRGGCGLPRAQVLLIRQELL